LLSEKREKRKKKTIKGDRKTEAQTLAVAARFGNTEFIEASSSKQ